MLSISFRSRFVRGAAILTSAFAVACGSDSTDGPKTPPKDVVPATITADATGTLSGVAGTQVNTPLGVTVLNKAGEPIDSAVVTFAVTSGGGSVSNTTVRTVAGKANTTWTLGSALGTQTVTATVGTLAPITFIATATAGAAKTITKLSTDPQTAVAGAAVAVAPSVKVTDANGNPVSNVLVSFVVASGGGTVTGGLANTDANGVATAGSWKLGGTAGVNTLTATAAGITSPVTFTATGTVGTASTIQITNTAPTLTPGQTFTFTATARDANGNLLSNPSLQWTSSNTGVATVSAAGVVTALGGGSTTITAAAGTATATATVNVIGRPGVNVFGLVPVSSSIGGISLLGNTVYVARQTANAIGVIDVPSATLTTSIDLGARTVDVVGRSNLIAGATQNPALVWFANSSNVKTDSIELPANALKMAGNAAGTKLFVDMDNFNIAVIDVASRTINNTIAAGGTGVAMKLGSGDSLIYLATRLGRLFIIDAATGSIRNTVDAGISISDFAITPDGKTAFITDGTSTLTVVPLASGGMPAQTLSVQGNIGALAVTPDGAQLWAAYPNGLAVIPIVNGSFDIIQPKNTGIANPTQLIFDRLGTFAIMADAAVNQIVIFK